jgi:hypothetical protein
MNVLDLLAVPHARFHLSRLRGRSTRSKERGGWGKLYPRDIRYLAGTPTPTLPRKREREPAAVA